MDDPRRAIAIEYLGVESRYAETMLSRMNAVDPMRQAPSHEAVEAFLDEWLSGDDWTRGMPMDGIVSMMELARRTLGVFLTVMAGTEVKAEPPPAENPEWTAEKAVWFEAMSREWLGQQSHPPRVNRLQPIFDAAFAKPEPVWPPKDCKLADLRTDHRSPCVVVCEFSLCPHAGERADG